MVALNFSPHGVFFQSGLDIIEDGYAAAVSGITQEINRKKAAFYDYKRHLENGGLRTEERDDEGNLIWSQDDELQSVIEIAEDALTALRKAYAITIYHHWERSALQWSGRENEKHDDLVCLVLKMGYPIDDRLNVVRYLANLLKHANDHWGCKLVQSWPELFPVGFTPSVDGSWSMNWYDHVSLSDANVRQIMMIVRGSGPKTTLEDF